MIELHQIKVLKKNYYKKLITANKQTDMNKGKNDEVNLVVTVSNLIACRLITLTKFS